MNHLIGIFGGTFNPVHLGHLHVAEELLKKLPLEEIRFLPCYSPVHRNAPTCTPQDRVNMLQLALQNMPNTRLDTHEIDREGPSYMIDTLKILTTEHPDETLCLIMGSDSFASLDTWKDWQQLTDYCHIIVVNRPGYQSESSQASQFMKPKLATSSEDLSNHTHGLVLPITIQPSPISASELRENQKNGKSLAAFLPKDVWQYIQDRKLYQ